MSHYLLTLLVVLAGYLFVGTLCTWYVWALVGREVTQGEGRGFVLEFLVLTALAWPVWVASRSPIMQVLNLWLLVLGNGTRDPGNHEETRS